MTIRIGYIQLLVPGAPADEQAAMLRRMGANVVRVEETVDKGGCKPLLAAICAFIGEGDELIVPELKHIGETAAAVRAVARRLEAAGAGLHVLDPDISTFEPAGRAFMQALESVEAAPADDLPADARARQIAAWDVHALRAQGFGPSQIARKLGVSRMTVWRKLKDLEAELVAD